VPELGELAAPVQELLERSLGALEGPVVPLQGGITNRNLRVTLGGEDYVVRLCGKDTSVLGIDRQAEVLATRAAHALGVAPEVVLYLPEHDCLVTRFVPGLVATSDELRRSPLLSRVATALRAFHNGPSLPASFNAFRLGELYRDETVARGGTVPPLFVAAKAVADRIEGALTDPEHDPVPCHNDFLTANFLLGTGGGVTILDWEYAGMGDRYFDLGNLSVNNDFSDDDGVRLLEAYWAQPATERRIAALRLMRLMSDYREGAWGMVQGALSELEFDYAAYADKHFARLLSAASDPRLGAWLDAASDVQRPGGARSASDPQQRGGR
jgi:thiamine kinase-like enzyme